MEDGGIDKGDEVFQVLSSATEGKVDEGREDCTLQWRWGYLVGAGQSASETKPKRFEGGQGGQVGDHRLG